MTLAADGTTVMARQCGPDVSSQMWSGYSDDTLRTHSRCLDITGPGVGAKAKVAACTGAASQKWEISQASANDFGPITNAGTGTVLSYPRQHRRRRPAGHGTRQRRPEHPLARLLPPLLDRRLIDAAWRVRNMSRTRTGRRL